MPSTPYPVCVELTPRVASSRRALRRASLLLLLALLPALAYVGHWDQLLPSSATAPAAVHQHEAPSEPAPANEHADHCHEGVEDCGAQGSAGALVSLSASFRAAAAPLARLAPAPHVALPLEAASSAPLTPPPRVA
jgi:hypothetical protein